MGILGIVEQLADALLGRDTPPVVAIPATVEQVVEQPLSAPPYATPLAASPARRQFETWLERATTAKPSGTVTVSTRPDWYCVYMRYTTAAAGDGVWVSLGGSIPTAPTPLDTAPKQVPVWCPYDKHVYIHGGERQISWALEGTNTLDVIVIAGKNIISPR